MGKVIAKIKLTNQADLVLQELKLLKGKPRSVDADVLVVPEPRTWGETDDGGILAMNSAFRVVRVFRGSNSSFQVKGSSKA